MENLSQQQPQNHVATVITLPQTGSQQLPDNRLQAFKQKKQEDDEAKLKAEKEAAMKKKEAEDKKKAEEEKVRKELALKQK